MAEIKDVSKIAKKWARVTPQRTEDYEEGVKSPRRDWESSTKEAAENWKSGVQKAAQEGRFEKGVSQAGTEKWKENTVKKGINRWGEGVRLAESDFARGFAPYAETIASLQLPPRYPKGDPRNIDRVAAIAKALRAKKLGKS